MNKLKKQSVVDFLLEKYPLNTQEEWDKAGFSFKNNLNYNIKGILTCVDITTEVVNYCINNDINLIISHHPFIFAETKQKDILQNPYKKQIINLINQHKITTLSLHTNYDIDNEGTSFQIVKLLGFSPFLILNYAVMFKLNSNINILLSALKNNFNVENTRSNFQIAKSFENAILLSGSGDYNQIVSLSKQYKNSLFISSDFKWNEWIGFNQMQIDVLEIPHLTEEVMAIDIKKQLESKFSIKVHFFKQKEIYFNN
ncbi:Nif3-like dinuclear metal center hexameric protein [Mycoplasma phocimorsus]|uniref:Nif3-like dinuclear metal center hexameric protein n=1 Tax=Mycoplasma phocimorsus TaxID=3045839 RepID=UPI0024C08B5F|nr:Nif3-like dinuclear metal center hexameric protein [Mycoplasma phocimorsus]MDJ1647921.1 Nif3-like dinuclear metal center hexameric protein [Mycoplasma phocimorsus]